MSLRYLSENLKGMSSLRRSVFMRKYNIKTKEAGCTDMDRIQLAQDRDQWCTLVNMLMNLCDPLKLKNFLTG